SDVVLAADAVLVAAIAGTGANSNLVPFADGTGSLWIAPECSSVTNLSLALLCCVLVVKATGREWTARNVTFGLLACLAVVAINVVRIASVAVHPDQFELVHGHTGAAVAGALSAGVVIGLCLMGIAGDAKVRA